MRVGLGIVGAGRAQARLGEAQLRLLPARDLLAQLGLARGFEQELVERDRSRRVALHVGGERGGDLPRPVGGSHVARRQVEHEALEPLDLLAGGEGDGLAEDLLLRGEPVGGRGQRDAGPLGHRAVGQRVRPLLADQLDRGAQDRVAARGAARLLLVGCLVHLCH